MSSKDEQPVHGAGKADATERLSEATVLNPTPPPVGAPPPPTRPPGGAASRGSRTPSAQTLPGEQESLREAAGSLPQGLQTRYKLLRVLGKGGFANVYLAYDSVLDQEVAIKILKLGLAGKADMERFLFEARVGAKLRHPNIATVFDILQTPEGLQMIMEYYPHGTLGDRIKKKGPLRPREAIDVCRQVAQALAYAHKRNFVHRDVKPANIFMAAEGMIKLGDFGIAAESEQHERTQTGMIIGTPLYMAPEQATDSRNVDPRADLYALGLTLYNMLTARPPRVVDLDLVPEPFRKLIKQSTESERGARPVSCEQFIAILDQIEQQLMAAQGIGGEERREWVELPETRFEVGATTPRTPVPVTTEASDSNLDGRSGSGQSTGTSQDGISTVTQQAATTQAGGISHRSLWLVLGLVIIVSLPSFYVAYKLTVSQPPTPTAETDPAATAMVASLPAPANPQSPSPAPTSGTPTTTPPPVAPTPQSTPTATPAPPSNPGQAPPQPAPAQQAIPLPGAFQPTPSATVLPTVPPATAQTPQPIGRQDQPIVPPGPRTLSEVLDAARRDARRPRIQRALTSMEGAAREPEMAATLLATAMTNLDAELRERRGDIVTHLLMAVTQRRLGNLPMARRHLRIALDMNRQQGNPIQLEGEAVRQAFALAREEEDMLRLPAGMETGGPRPPQQPPPRFNQVH